MTQLNKSDYERVEGEITADEDLWCTIAHLKYYAAHPTEAAKHLEHLLSVIATAATEIQERLSVDNQRPVGHASSFQLESLKKGQSILVSPHGGNAYDVPLYAAPQPVAVPDKECTCPSGDGSLRWPCPAHQPSSGALQLQMQPLVIDGHGTLRFKENPIVRRLLDYATERGYGLNEIAMEQFDADDQMQLAQLIGYSLSGYGTLSYVTDESYERAAASSPQEPTK